MRSVGVVLAVIGLVGCKPSGDPPLCSLVGQERIVAAGGSPELLAKLCLPDAGTVSVATDKSKTWKTPPVAITRIKTDPMSYVDKPTLVTVAIRPSSYFNYGYQNATSTHFAFDLGLSDPDTGAVTDLALHGYAKKSWARPFFERVSGDIEKSNGKYQWTGASLIVAFDPRRFDSKESNSAAHIEILAASNEDDFALSEDPSLLSGRQQTGPKPQPLGSPDKPPEEQVLRDAKAKAAADKAKANRMDIPWSLALESFKARPYDVDKFEKDSVAVVVDFSGGGGLEGMKGKGSCALEYQRTGSFWKLTSLDCRYK